MISSLTKVTLLRFPKRPSQTCLHSTFPVCLSNQLPCHNAYTLTPLYPRDEGGMLLQNAGIHIEDYKVSFKIQITVTTNINTLMYWTYQKKVRILEHDTNCLCIGYNGVTISMIYYWYLLHPNQVYLLDFLRLAVTLSGWLASKPTFQESSWFLKRLWTHHSTTNAATSQERFFFL